MEDMRPTQKLPISLNFSDKTNLLLGNPAFCKLSLIAKSIFVDTFTTKETEAWITKVNIKHLKSVLARVGVCLG